MTGNKIWKLRMPAVCLALILSSVYGFSNAQDFRRAPTPNDTLKSIRVLQDGKVLFRVYAPKAAEVSFGGSDIQNVGEAAKMMKREDGVWETTVGPVEPGSYRYNFSIDGVSTIDPKNPSTSESNDNTWSLVHI